MTAEVCPRDDKRPYVHKKAALDSYESLKITRGFDGLEAYACICGAWHLGHPKVLDSRR